MIDAPSACRVRERAAGGEQRAVGSPLEGGDTVLPGTECPLVAAGAVRPGTECPLVAAAEARWVPIGVDPVESGQHGPVAGAAGFDPGAPGLWRGVVRGTCMVPRLRPHDHIHVEARPVETITTGKIAVVRRPWRLLAHRVVGSGEDERGPYIVTRGDRSGGGDDGPSYGPEILGMVTRIERRGRLLEPDDAAPGLTRLGRGMRTGVLRLEDTLRRKAISRLDHGWNDGWLRGAGSLYWRWTVPGADMVLLAPYRAAGLVRKISGDERRTFRLPTSNAMEKVSDPMEKWSLELRKDGCAIAAALFRRMPEPCPLDGWCMTGLRVRARYRGSEATRRIVEEAVRVFDGSGTSRFRAILPRSGGTLPSWAGRLGFRAAEPELMDRCSDRRHPALSVGCRDLARCAILERGQGA